MKVTVTGASGLIGQALVAALTERGDEVTIFGRSAKADVQWDPLTGPPPSGSLDATDAVVHLAGESVAQRWSTKTKEAIRTSRVLGTANLVDGLRAAQPKPRVLISASAVGYYGDRGSEPVDESAAPGKDFLAGVCVDWEEQAAAAAELGLRVASLRTGVVLAPQGGALAQMLPPFRLGIGGPIGGGAQFIPWIHLDDVVGLYLAALSDERYSGPINATAPTPVTNRDFSHALGQTLHRPAVMPVPGFTLRLLYGEMSTIILTGVDARPARAIELGYDFRQGELGAALASLLGG